MKLIHRYLEDQIKHHDLDSKCGFCWEFLMGRRDHINLKGKGISDGCCVYFILDTGSIRSSLKKIDENFDYTDYSFSGWMLKDSSLANTYYNEKSNNYECVDNGKFTKHIEPIWQCLHDNFFANCSKMDVLSIDSREVLNEFDQNMDGIQFTIKARVML